MKTMTMTEIKRIHREKWKRANWFGPDEMKFFRTELGSGGYVRADGMILFATSEQPPNGKRAGTLRIMDPETGEIATLGVICMYSSMGSADKAAAQLAMGSA
jgi:hypothetical protein